MKSFIGILFAGIAIIGIIPLALGTKVEWTIYLGIPLIILTGSTGAALVTRKLEAIIGGVVLAALWPLFFEVIKLI